MYEGMAAASALLQTLSFLLSPSSSPVALLAQVVSPEDMVGYAEHAKGSAVSRVFEDAYKSPLSIVILVCCLSACHYSTCRCVAVVYGVLVSAS